MQFIYFMGARVWLTANSFTQAFNAAQLDFNLHHDDDWKKKSIHVKQQKNQRIINH
jgi:hypothetical protein